MNNFVLYLIISSTCLIITYLFFKFLIDNRISFALMRFFLLTAIVCSLLLPFHSYIIDLGFINPPEMIEKTEETFIVENAAVKEQMVNQTQQTKIDEATYPKKISRWMLVNYIYFIVMGFFLIRLLLNLFKILYLRIVNKAENLGKYRIIVTDQISNSFSYFRWIFLNKEGKS